MLVEQYMYSGLLQTDVLVAVKTKMMIKTTTTTSSILPCWATLVMAET